MKKIILAILICFVLSGCATCHSGRFSDKAYPAKDKNAPITLSMKGLDEETNLSFNMLRYVIGLC